MFENCEKLVELLEKIVLQSGPEYSENKEDTTLSLMIAPPRHHRHRVQREQGRYHPLLVIAPLATTAIAAIPLSPSSPPTTPSPRHP